MEAAPSPVEAAAESHFPVEKKAVPAQGQMVEWLLALELELHVKITGKKPCQHLSNSRSEENQAQIGALPRQSVRGGTEMKQLENGNGIGALKRGMLDDANSEHKQLYPD